MKQEKLVKKKVLNLDKIKIQGKLRTQMCHPLWGSYLCIFLIKCTSSELMTLKEKIGGIQIVKPLELSLKETTLSHSSIKLSLWDDKLIPTYTYLIIQFKKYKYLVINIYIFQVITNGKTFLSI